MWHQAGCPVLTASRHHQLYCVDVSLPVTNEFRDLERPQAVRKKDVVLMATVASFESLPRPSRSELRQFAELFTPLFAASSEPARRDAVAALSQSTTVPAPVAFFIASQPIAIAAPFLVSSPCLSDEALITIARSQGEAHARAIARRESLSPTVIDALVGLRYQREASPKAEAADASPPEIAADNDRLAREELLRQQIRSLAAHLDRPPTDRLGLRTLSLIQAALLVRFARNRENGLFAAVLADALSASSWLAERIMLDISGQQVATTLRGLAMERTDAIFVLQRLYDHLGADENGRTRAEALWDALDEEQCSQRIEAWRRADRYTHAMAQPALTTARGDEQQPRLIRTSSSLRSAPRHLARGR